MQNTPSNFDYNLFQASNFFLVQLIPPSFKFIQLNSSISNALLSTQKGRHFCI